MSNDPAVVTQVPWQGSAPPGVVVNLETSAKANYVGSPSLTILPNGEYIATHDLFGNSTTKNTTKVFASSDQGKTWQLRSVIQGQFWSTVSVHEGQLYVMGTDRQDGWVVIRRSVDQGRTWTTPNTLLNGLLMIGRFATAPTPVVVHNGRIWRAMEEVVGSTWGMNYRPFVMSAPLGSNLLSASSWTASNRIIPQASWLGKTFGGFLEGNIVVDAAGQIVNMLRVHQNGYAEKAALIRISADGRTATFNPATDFIDFPGGTKKFTVRYDAASGKYWSLTNHVPEQFYGAAKPERTRNTLALVVSSDLRNWQVDRIVLQHQDVASTGFQYADWQFEGGDLIAVIRTAFQEPSGRKAASAHDSNFLTFVRIKNFRG